MKVLKKKSAWNQWAGCGKCPWSLHIHPVMLTHQHHLPALTTALQFMTQCVHACMHTRAHTCACARAATLHTGTARTHAPCPCPECWAACTVSALNPVSCQSRFTNTTHMCARVCMTSPCPCPECWAACTSLALHLVSRQQRCWWQGWRDLVRAEGCVE